MSDPLDDGGPLATGTVHAPWTPSQVRAIEAWQKTPSVHPLTCRTSEHGALFVTSEHLVCDTCGFEQTWVPWVCAEMFPNDFALPLTAKLVDQVAERLAKQTGERVAALTIAIKLMEMHLEIATPGGAGRDSLAWTIAQGRLEVLRGLLAELRASQPPQPSVD